jgi:hypothetical protein
MAETNISLDIDLKTGKQINNTMFEGIYSLQRTIKGWMGRKT